MRDDFIQDLYDDWQKHGAATIEKVRDEKPDAYLRVVASILPQKLELAHVDSMTDDERRTRIRELADELGCRVDFGLAGGNAGALRGGEAPAGPDETPPLPALP